MDRQSLQE